MAVFNCDLTAFESLWFQLDNMLYEFQPKQYLIIYRTTKETQCYFSMRSLDNNFNLLGINFLVGFYQLYDMPTHQVAFAPN